MHLRQSTDLVVKKNKKCATINLIIITVSMLNEWFDNVSTCMDT